MSAPLRVADRHRRVPADLRRQRMEHVGAVARPRRARPPRRGRQGRHTGRRGLFETTVRRPARHRVLPAAPERPGRPQHAEERAAVGARSSATCATRLRDSRVDMVHGQHAMTTVPAIRAAPRADMPAVATVRDYWPVCYWSDLIYDPSQPHAVSGMLGGDDDAAACKPRAGGVPSGRVAADSVHAREPADQAARRWRGRARSSRRAMPIARDLRARAPEIARTRRSTRFPIPWT